MDEKNLFLSRFINLKIIGIIFLLILILVWQGIPAINKWKADQIVDELCFTDGGNEIYEVIKLPEDQYDKYWLVNLPSNESADSDANYFHVLSTSDIRGSLNTENINELVIWRSEDKIVRASDNKIMARLVSYIRRGGDPIGPWHPSSYRCPKDGFSRNVFIIQ